MDPEFLQLAREAVAALQAAGEPSWTDVAGVTVGFLQCGVIAWGLWRWGKDIDARRRKMDQQEIEAGQRHEETMAALRARLERTAPARSPSGG